MLALRGSHELMKFLPIVGTKKPLPDILNILWNIFICIPYYQSQIQAYNVE